jgi:hypothetical protein
MERTNNNGLSSLCIPSLQGDAENNNKKKKKKVMMVKMKMKKKMI